MRYTVGMLESSLDFSLSLHSPCLLEQIELERAFVLLLFPERMSGSRPPPARSHEPSLHPRPSPLFLLKTVEKAYDLRFFPFLYDEIDSIHPRICDIFFRRRLLASSALICGS